jgi:hypothetical protein
MKRITLFFALALCWIHIFAQQQNQQVQQQQQRQLQQLPVSAETEAAYRKGTRDKSGRPGAKYWQNTARYNLKVNFNPESRLLKGTADIVYINNSPDTLKQIWFKLYPNLYKKGAPVKSKIASSDQTEGVDISRLKIGDALLEASKYVIDNTNMHVDIAPLLPGKKLNMSVQYTYTLNEGSHVRTGQVDKGSYFVAYFFPRIAVYDDIDGWNKYPYTGDAEFYNDFCDFNAEITVPRNFVTWATGDLLNADQVLSSKVAQRLRQAEKSDAVVNVITAADLKARSTTSTQAFNTFRFQAKDVTDFVFAISDHYLWKSASVVVDSATSRRTRVDAAFNPVHKDYYEVIDFAKYTVRTMSHVFPKWPFPYNHETVFDGLDQMEYPMMVNDNPVKNREDAITLTVHEIFHTMFPFYMGINETKHAWMDEGWATLGEWEIGPMIDTTMVDLYGVEPTAITSGRKDDTPIMTLTTELKGAGSFTNSYPKPAMGYRYVRGLLGDTLFTKALHHYIDQWKGKHPIPQDFFYSMNEGSRRNLDWFWNRWFYEDGITDMGITAVHKTSSGYQVVVENKSTKPLPIDLTLTFDDGSKTKIHKNIGVWETGNSSVFINVNSTGRLVKVVMGDAHTPDKNKTDNSFTL